MIKPSCVLLQCPDYQSDENLVIRATYVTVLIVATARQQLSASTATRTTVNRKSS